MERQDLVDPAYLRGHSVCECGLFSILGMGFWVDLAYAKPLNPFGKPR